MDIQYTIYQLEANGCSGNHLLKPSGDNHRHFGNHLVYLSKPGLTEFITAPGAQEEKSQYINVPFPFLADVFMKNVF